MIHLTQKEKADRFDALQMAFQITNEHYLRRKEEADKRTDRTDLIGAYNKGISDTCGSILADLERWIV